MKRVVFDYETERRIRRQQRNSKAVQKRFYGNFAQAMWYYKKYRSKVIHMLPHMEWFKKRYKPATDVTVELRRRAPQNEITIWAGGAPGLITVGDEMVYDAGLDDDTFWDFIIFGAAFFGETQFAFSYQGHVAPHELDPPTTVRTDPEDEYINDFFGSPPAYQRTSAHDASRNHQYQWAESGWVKWYMKSIGNELVCGRLTRFDFTVWYNRNRCGIFRFDSENSYITEGTYTDYTELQMGWDLPGDGTAKYLEDLSWGASADYIGNGKYIRTFNIHENMTASVAFEDDGDDILAPHTYSDAFDREYFNMGIETHDTLAGTVTRGALVVPGTAGFTNARMAADAVYTQCYRSGEAVYGNGSTVLILGVDYIRDNGNPSLTGPDRERYYIARSIDYGATWDNYYAQTWINGYCDPGTLGLASVIWGARAQRVFWCGDDCWVIIASKSTYNVGPDNWTYDGYYAVTSTDDGITWSSPTEVITYYQVPALTMPSSRPQPHITVIGDRGIYMPYMQSLDGGTTWTGHGKRSIDGGLNWTTVVMPAEATDGKTLAWDSGWRVPVLLAPNSGSGTLAHLGLIVWDGTKDVIYESTNGGFSWTLTGDAFSSLAKVLTFSERQLVQFSPIGLNRTLDGSDLDYVMASRYT